MLLCYVYILNFSLFHFLNFYFNFCLNLRTHLELPEISHYLEAVLTQSIFSLVHTPLGQPWETKVRKQIMALHIRIIASDIKKDNQAC